jgi:uncharacterized protein
MLLEYFKFFFIGIFGGIISGLLGIGGGVLILPILIYFTHLEIKVAAAISTINVFFASTIGTYFSSKNKSINFRYALAFGLASSATSFLGSYFTKLIPDLVIKLIYLLSVILAIIFFFLKRKNHKSSSSFEKEITRIPSKKDYFIILSIAIFFGFIFGVIGVGGGFLYVPLIIILFDFPIKVAIGTSLFIMLLNSIPGLIGKLLTVKFDIFIGIAVGIGALVGARLGAYIHRKINEKIIRIIFIIILSVIIVKVGIDLVVSLQF